MGRRKKVEDLPSGPLDQIGELLDGDLAKKIKERFGKNIWRRASDVPELLKGRIPTGVFPLDYALNGGVEAGKVTIFYGPKSSSKTTTAFRVLANAQGMCADCWSPTIDGYTGEVCPCKCGNNRPPKIAFINTEPEFSRKWATRLGIDLTQVLYSHCDHGEQAVDICDAIIRSGEADVILLDSLAFLTPTKEIETSVTKDKMGLQARMIGEGVRKWNSGLIYCIRELGRAPTLILTNQIRMKLGVMFGNPETTPGGLAPGFVATTEVRCRSIKVEREANTGEPQTMGMGFRITKQKAGIPEREGTYELVLTPHDGKKLGDVVDEPVMMNFAERHGLLTKVTPTGTKWNLLDEEFRAKKLVGERLRTDISFKHALRMKLFEIMLREE